MARNCAGAAPYAMAVLCAAVWVGAPARLLAREKSPAAERGDEAQPVRDKLGRIAGTAHDPVVSGHASSDGCVAWVTLEIDLTAPAKLKGRKLFIVSSDDIAARAGDLVECDLSATPVSRRRDGAYEVSMDGVKNFSVSPPPPAAAPQPPPKNAKRTERDPGVPDP